MKQINEGTKSMLVTEKQYQALSEIAAERNRINPMCKFTVEMMAREAIERYIDEYEEMIRAFRNFFLNQDRQDNTENIQQKGDDMR